MSLKFFQRFSENNDTLNFIKAFEIDYGVNYHCDYEKETSTYWTIARMFSSSVVVYSGAIRPKRNSLHDSKDSIIKLVLISNV